jgi:hypothetical protein
LKGIAARVRCWLSGASLRLTRNYSNGSYYEGQTPEQFQLEMWLTANPSFGRARTVRSGGPGYVPASYWPMAGISRTAETV